MIITIASGKGGTGKTTVAVNLAASAGREVTLIDCDVEEPNAALFINPHIAKAENVFIFVPEINEDKCTLCGECSNFCSFNALALVGGKLLLFPHLCHSCSGCRLVCPVGAISDYEKVIGKIEEGSKENIRFLQGRLNVGEPMGGPLISALKKKINSDGLTIIDAPPGTSCSMIETVADSDFCLLVTEPTPFGLNDLKLAAGVVKKLKIPTAVIINRSGSGDYLIEEFCKKQNIQVIMKIPIDRKFAHAYSKGELIVNTFPEYKELFSEVLKEVLK